LPDERLSLNNLTKPSEDKLTAIRPQRLPNLKLVMSESHLLTPIDLTFKEGPLARSLASAHPDGRRANSGGHDTPMLCSGMHWGRQAISRNVKLCLSRCGMQWMPILPKCVRALKL
jgi:hypothetical protein